MLRSSLDMTTCKKQSVSKQRVSSPTGSCAHSKMISVEGTTAPRKKANIMACEKEINDVF